MYQHRSSFQSTRRLLAAIFAAGLALAAAALRPPASTGAADPVAPATFRVRLESSQGAFDLDVHRQWAPHGADRFYRRVKEGYFDDSRFFRVVAGRWAQFGIAGDPARAQAWRNLTFPDDPPVHPNVKGTVAFAFAVANGRTTQVFINLRDNSATLDGQGFAPFAEVVDGMDAVVRLNAEYGETAGGGIRGGQQDPLFAGGNAYLDEHYPGLDRLRRALILPPDRQ